MFGFAKHTNEVWGQFPLMLFLLARRNPVPQYTRIVQLNCDIILQKNENSTTIPPNDLGTAPML